MLNDTTTPNQPPPLPPWEKLAKGLTDDPLQHTRDVAGKWVAILSALVGLSTVFGLIQGRDALSKLSLVSQIALVIVFILALLASVIAIYLAALASEGTPGFVPLDEKNFNSWYRNSTNQAISQFRRSRQLALVSVILVVIGLGITWFGPGQPATGTSILVVQKSGTVVCGTLTKDKAGNLLLTSNGQTIVLNDVVSLNVVPTCP
jgi:hypothetical protein